MPVTRLESDPARLRFQQTRVFWLLWGAYASYYLCRVNFAVAQPAILQEFPDWTAAQIGTIPSAYAAVYAMGQIVNGTLGQRYGTRRMMTLAMVMAGVSNVLFYFTTSFESMRLLWLLNGWGQSAGWSLMVGTITDWNTSGRRGTLIGRLSTCYQVGNVASWLLAGALCDWVGWRAAFLVPGLFLLPMAAVLFIFLRDTPEQAGFAPVRDDVPVELPATESNANATADSDGSGWANTWSALKVTLTNRILWILAIGFFVLNAVRYSFMNWTVQYLAEFHGGSIKDSALTAIVVPLAGSLGALAAGWASDNWFGRRRVPVCVLMLTCLALVCGAMTVVQKGDWWTATGLMALAGFMIYGPDMLISGAATADLSHPKAGAMATGLTMCLGALGAIFSGAGIGYIKDLAHGNWAAVF
ncbi:MAG TPA: MFS transporter, partial [Verrucomicrobiae bacterium]|nr:MFS transporter [Verrucomicrobiae bacterium]